MAGKVLVVDDEESIQQLLVTWLNDAGYETCVASEGEGALRLLYRERPNLVVVDILMPRMDGYEFCRQARAMCEVPIMMLTALGEAANKVQGLGLGADDYVVKPVGMDEFLARVSALLRRSRWSGGQNFAVRNYADEVLTIDHQRHETWVRGKNVEFTPTEFNLLCFLTERAGKICKTQDIIHGVWGHSFCSPDVVRWHIASLRTKIEEEPGKPRRIITVWGVGYRYEILTRVRPSKARPS